MKNLLEAELTAVRREALEEAAKALEAYDAAKSAADIVRALAAQGEQDDARP